MAPPTHRPSHSADARPTDPTPHQFVWPNSDFALFRSTAHHVYLVRSRIKWCEVGKGMGREEGEGWAGR